MRPDASELAEASFSGPVMCFKHITQPSRIFEDQKQY